MFTIEDAIRVLRQVHEHHGNLEVTDDTGRPIVGITIDRGTTLERLFSRAQPRCLISAKRRE